MQRVFLKLIWLTMLLIACWSGEVLAHGGGTSRLTDVAVGPYRLFVWSQPDSPRIGEMHFTVAVVEMDGDAAASDSGTTLDTPVLDAIVQLKLRAASNPEQILSGTATRDQALFPQYYETDLVVPAAGTWQAHVTVTGPKGAGDASFEFAVLPPRQINWMMVTGGILLLLLISIAGRLRGKARTTG